MQYRFDIPLDEAIKVIKKRDGISNDFDTELAEAAYVLLTDYERLVEDYKHLQGLYWDLDATKE